MGFLKDVLAVIVAEQIYPSKKEKVIDRKINRMMERQDLILRSLGYETEPYNPPTDYIEKGITIFCKIAIILIGTLIILSMIALKVLM